MIAFSSSLILWMEIEGRDDNVSRPTACRNGKDFNVFLTYFYFSRKDSLYKLHLYIYKIFIYLFIFSGDPILTVLFLFVLEGHPL